jgi:hypothetical protein
MTLIRLVRGLPDPAVSTSPRVLGVDEFALRKGRSYGTLLVDVETRRPVDILPERSSDSFSAWLAARQEVIAKTAPPGSGQKRYQPPGTSGCDHGGRAARSAPDLAAVRGGRPERG